MTPEKKALIHSIWQTSAFAILVTLLGYLVVSTLYTYRIAGGSMEPTIPLGARIIVMQTTGPFERGDVITFYEGDHVVTHTFIEYNDDGMLRTRGDANETADRFDLHEDEVIGKVLYHTRVGGILAWLIDVLACLVLAMIIVLPLWVIWSKPFQQTREENPSPNPA
jgi:signal peptidase I